MRVCTYLLQLGYGSPAAGLPTDNFSVRWTGNFNFTAGDYTFFASGDDYINVWLDGQLILSASWQDGTVSATYTLTGGSHQIKVEQTESYGGAGASLSWR